MSVWAVLVAAGRESGSARTGRRRSSRLGELPLLAEPLRRLDDSDWIDAIVVAAPAGWEEPAILLAEELGARRWRGVTGGETRAESVRAGSRRCRRTRGDPRARRGAAARHRRRDRARARRRSRRASTAPSRACRSPTRSSASTAIGRRDRRPRGARRRADAAGVRRSGAPGRIRRRAETPRTAQSLVEARGGRITLVEGDPRLLKVTTRADLELVATWL